MGSVFGPLELTGAPEPPIVHRAAHAIHMQMRSRRGRGEGSGVEGGVGPGCVIQQMTGAFCASACKSAESETFVWFH